MKTPTIYKYILRELSLNFLLSIAFLNSILTTNNLFSLSKKFLDFGVSFFDLFILVLLLQPQLMLLTIPIALFLGTLITYGRLNMDNELIVLRASGMSHISVARPIFTAGIMCFIIGLSISFYLGPLSASKLKENINTIISTRLPAAIKEGDLNTAFEDIVIMPQDKTSSNTFKGMFIYDGRKKDPVIIWAKKASIVPQQGSDNINITLRNGEVYITRENSLTEIAFDKYQLFLKMQLPKTTMSIHELSFRELVNRKSKDLSTMLEIHRRLSLPVVSLLLMLLAPPLFPLAGKTGRLGGMTIGLVVCAAYYLMSIYLDNLVRAGKLNHFIGGWGTTALLGICAAVAFYRMSKR
ncbi:MAG: LptF/LptG family permease [Nitrospirota bacterium]